MRPFVPDHPDMLVALAGCRAHGWVRHRGGAWLDDHRHGRVGLALGHGLVDGFAVVGTVRRHRGVRWPRDFGQAEKLSPLE